MNAADQFRIWLDDRGLLPGYRVQFGAWRAGESQTDKYAIIRPIGGVASELVRRPVVSLTLIGAVDQIATELYDRLNIIVEAAKVDYCVDGIPSIEFGEPVVMQTDDARPMAVCDVQFIQSLADAIQ